MSTVFAAVLVLTTAYDVEVLRNNGPSANRIDLVILGDGYRLEDQPKLTSDATSIVNQLFASTPWKEYAALFNVSVVHVVSNENGADHGSYGETRDTALGAYFGCGGIDRTICVNQVAVISAGSTATPQYDLLIVLANDPKYGGSGGDIAVLSTHMLAPELMMHELGHTLGGLADEYEDAYPAYPACQSPDCPEANASLIGTSAVKWSAWLEGTTPTPTPENQAMYVNAIGAFEGARYQPAGVFRPKDTNCRMKVLGSPNCSVCSEGLIRRFLNRVDLIDSFTPTQPMTTCGPVTFVLTTVAVADPTAAMTYTWRVNGVDQMTGRMLQVPVGTGLTVSVTAKHTTSLVRSDPQNLLSQVVTFPHITPGASCDAGVVVPDAGPAVDGGTPDAGLVVDAGAVDAGAEAADASVNDGGLSERPDAGLLEDGGGSDGGSFQVSNPLSTVVTATSEGCGCNSSGLGLMGPVLFGVSCLLRLRRPRKARPS